MTTATKPTASTPTPPAAPRVTLALASDPGKALHLAPTFQPDVDLLTAEGLLPLV